MIGRSAGFILAAACAIGAAACGGGESAANRPKRTVVPRGGEPEGDYVFVPKTSVGALCAVAGESGEGPIQVRKPGAPPRNEIEQKEDLATKLVRDMLGELVATKGLRAESVPPVWMARQAMQIAVQEVSQHTSSAQWPLVHS